MMTSITRKEFRLKYPYSIQGSFRSAIFAEKKALLKEIFATDYPVYLDSFYYGSPSNDDTFVLKTKEDIDYLKNWRECHYFNLYRNSTDTERAWIMTGGRYD